MARIALGIAGGIIGGLIGGPAGASIGFSLGNVLGSVLFPPKLPTNYGPRLNDKQVLSSAAGEPIPFGYGTFRISGNVIWSESIKEIKTSQTQSAKGGPSQSSVTYSYTCSFAIGFCEGPADILRIWADSKLIYDRTGKTAVSLDTGITNSGGVAQTAQFTPVIYSGSATQNPDPTIQAIEGINNTPAFRDTCYVVFNDFPLADFGNRIPSFRAEISTGNTTAYIKDLYSGMGVIAHTGSGDLVLPPKFSFVDAVNRRAVFTDDEGQAVMTIDLSAPTNTIVPAWAANNVQQIGDQILDSNGNIQTVILVSGDQKTGGTQPTWTGGGEGAQTVDHHVTWLNSGVGPSAISVLAKGFLDSSIGGQTVAGGTYNADINGSIAVDTAGNIWTVPLLTKPGGGSDFFFVRHDPLTFKATGVSLALGGRTPVSMTPAHINGQDLMYCRMFDGTLLVVDAKSMVFGNAVTVIPPGSGASATGTAYGIAVDPTTGVAYTLSYSLSLPFLNTQWYITKYDPRGDGSVQYTAMESGTGHDGYGLSPFLNVHDNSLLVMGIGSDNTHASIRRVDLATMTVTHETSISSNAFVLSLAATAAVGYRNLVPTNGIFYVVDNSVSSNLVGYNGNDLSIASTTALNHWYPAIGTGQLDCASSGFSYDETTRSFLVATEGDAYQGVGSRFYLDRGVAQAATLDSVVSNILQRCDVDPSNIDVSQITNQSVEGYVCARLSDAKAVMQPLALAYFFDLVESDFKIKAVPRGQTASQNIAETSLGTESDQYKLVETIAQEQDIPKTVSVEYQDPRLNYQQGKQHKYRSSRVKKAKSHDILTLPLALQADEAAQIADKYLSMLWAERNMYDLKLWEAKYLVIDPTDVVQFTYQGMPFQARIVKHTLGQNKILEISGVSEDARQYLSTEGGAGTIGFQGGSIITPSSTLLFLLDVPLLQDIDAGVNSGVYYLMSSPLPDAWPGAALFQSADNLSYTQVDSDFDEATYGSVSLTTPAPAFSPFSWDMTTTITVKLVHGSLSSTTEAAVLNGANGFILGGEVMQFQFASLNGDGSYTLSKLLRGRRGTEAACATHIGGETFLLLNSSTKRIGLSTSLIGLLRYYKAATLGMPATATSYQTLSLAGNDLKPYAPAQFFATIDGSNNINATWVRRTRYGGEWQDGTGTVPLNETTESYDLLIYDSTGTTLKRTVAGLTSPSYSYTAAQQTTDFGSTQTSVYAVVYQNSSVVGRGFPAINPTLGTT